MNMMIAKILFEVLCALLFAMLFHEGGHYVVAKLFGYTLHFTFEFGKILFIPVPRGVWEMPDTDRWKQRCIALAGFVCEFLASILFAFLCPSFAKVYIFVALIHLCAYRFYAGDASDFNFI